MSRYRSGEFVFFACCVFLAGAFCGCDSAEVDDPSALLVTASLPFTGDSAGLGSTLEHALLLAVEQVNAAGGVVGRPLRLKTTDTQSSLLTGYRAVSDAFAAKPLIFIGPDNPSLLKQVAAAAQDNGIVAVSPSLTATPSGETVIEGSAYLARLNPSLATLAASMAREVYASGLRRTSIANISDVYATAFFRAFGAQFSALGGAVDAVQFAPNAAYDSAAIEQILTFKPDSILLATPPGLGASIVNDVYLTRLSDGLSDFVWRFAPSLNSDVFLRSKIPSAAASGSGVEPRLYDDGEFAALYRRRWLGEAPSNDAHFYFDALIYAALSAEAAASGGLVPAGDALSQKVRQAPPISAPTVHWNDLARALQAAREQHDFMYIGCTGVVQFNGSGIRTVDEQSVVATWRP